MVNKTEVSVFVTAGAHQRIIGIWIPFLRFVILAAQRQIQLKPGRSAQALYLRMYKSVMVSALKYASEKQD